MQMKKNNWDTKGSKLIHENPYMRIVEYDVVRPNGTRLPYYVLDREDYAVIVTLDNKLQTTLIGQYRYAIGEYTWEFPAGFARSKTQLTNAKIELQEEAGITASKWSKLGVLYAAPGHSRVRAHVFLAENLKYGASHPEPNEFVESKTIAIAQLSRMIKINIIKDAPTICAYHLLEVYLEKRGISK